MLCRSHEPAAPMVNRIMFPNASTVNLEPMTVTSQDKRGLGAVIKAGRFNTGRTNSTAQSDHMPSLQRRQLPPKGSWKPPGNPGTPEIPKTLHSITGPKVETITTRTSGGFRSRLAAFFSSEQKLPTCDGCPGRRDTSMFTGVWYATQFR